MRIILLLIFFASSLVGMQKRISVSFAESPKEKRKRVAARLITSFIGKESDTLTKRVGKIFLQKVKQSDAGDPQFWEAVNQIIEETREKNEGKQEEEESILAVNTSSGMVGAAVQSEKESRLSQKLEQIRGLLISSLEEAVEKQHCADTERKYEYLKHSFDRLKFKLRIASFMLGITSVASGAALLFVLLAS